MKNAVLDIIFSKAQRYRPYGPGMIYADIQEG